MSRPSAPARCTHPALWLALLAGFLMPAVAAPPPAPPHAAAATAASPRPPRAVRDAEARELHAGRFGTVHVYVPAGTAQSVAIFLSGDGGWELGVINMAHALRGMGAVVVGVDIRAYFASLRRVAQRADAHCQMIAADFESLSHQVQKQIGLTEYRVPVLVGYSSGATVAYAALVQSPPGTFAGALSLGFCADQDFAGAELCPGNGLHYRQNAQHELVFEPAKSLRQPWVALQGGRDQVCDPHAADEFAAQVEGGAVVKLPQVGHGFSVERNWMPQFRAAYSRLAALPAAPAPSAVPGIADLPLEEVHASTPRPELALLLTGDGGWAGLDQELAARLAANGVPTVALNSLKYFWTARTPEETSRDVARVLRHYLAAWDAQRVLLIGYSFGADVLPFVVNRLPPELRARIASVSLLGIDAHAAFEIHVTEWVADEGGGPPTVPEIEAIGNLPVLCLYGEGEADSICPQLPAGTVSREQIGSGHHFGGEYALLADRILGFSRGHTP
ncbi:MAG: virulence factor family protein [Gammaproteobacteria bacterium]|nr:virulence factor family protein [Gammaproteobacteria bacterium]MBV8307876.1 virulence factor family protein [Gammaproteobacteria bacterium]